MGRPRVDRSIERRVLDLLAQRCTHAMIAKMLHIGRTTIAAIRDREHEASMPPPVHRSSLPVIPEPPELTNEIIFCEKCRHHVYAPCMACWTREHAVPKLSVSEPDTDYLELSPESGYGAAEVQEVGFIDEDGRERPPWCEVEREWHAMVKTKHVDCGEPVRRTA